MKKKEALAKYLEIETNEIVESKYDENIFEISPTQVKRGTSPKEALRLVNQLRDVLRPFYNDVDKWTTDTFKCALYDEEKLQIKISLVVDTIESEKRKLPMFTPNYYICASCGVYHDYHNPYTHNKNCTDKTNILKSNKKRKAIYFDLDVPNFGGIKYSYQNTYNRLTESKMKLDKLKEQYNKLPLYKNIQSILQKNNPDCLKIGTHEVLNTLYYLMPENDNAKQHKDILCKAFNNEELKDTRTSEPSNSGEYMVLTDEEADEKAAEYIKDSVWAFNSDFIIQHSNVLDFDKGSEQIIKAIQEQYENGSEAMLKLIDDIDNFIKCAIEADGRGHFLNTYNGEEREIELEEEYYYIYRIN